MTKVIWPVMAQAALEAAHTWLVERGAPDAADAAIDEIFAKTNLLATTPRMGNEMPEAGPNRYELLVPFGKSGYAVLYHYDTKNDEAVILNIKHYRQLDYK